MFKGHLSALAEYAQLPTKLLDVIDTVKQRLATHPSNGRYTLRDPLIISPKRNRT